MPVMDGFQACKILKEKNKTKEIPIVFLTAKFIMERDRQTGLQLGADDYIVKPFNSKELVSRMKTILRKNQLMKMFMNGPLLLMELKLLLSGRMKKVAIHIIGMKIYK